MDDFNLKQETPSEGEEAPIISDHREYLLKFDEQTKFNTRIEKRIDNIDQRLDNIIKLNNLKE